MKGLILLEENYYDILEVSQNASPEIIEKAYKTLVKKYHPDLQKEEEKNKYEEKIKKINEAYDILSNSEKRKNYDLNLKDTQISISDYNRLYEENINLKNNLNILKQKLNYLNYYNNLILENNQNSENYEKNKNVNTNNYSNFENYKSNKNNYEYNNLNNKNYNYFNFKDFFNFEKFLKNILALIITIFIFLILFFILWHIPFTKNYLINLYNSNSILQFFVNLFLNIFK